MAHSANQKEKLIRELMILWQETDEEHPLTAAQIIERLEEDGIQAERKTIYDDVRTLIKLGFDIEQTHGIGVYMRSRRFELVELKMLVDAVQSSKFISEAKSRILIGKLEEQCSKYDAKSLQRQVVVSGRVKTMNSSVFYSVDAIHEAIGENKKLEFYYFDYDAHGNKVFRHGKKLYKVSPVGLLCSDESYYLVALEEQGERPRHYRVDRMASAKVSSETRVAGCEDINMGTYGTRHFGMFGGETEKVRIRFRNEMSHIVLDRFGKDCMLVPDGDSHFTLTAEIVVSPQFYGWLFALADGAELLGPQHVREAYAEMLRNAARLHSKE